MLQNPDERPSSPQSTPPVTPTDEATWSTVSSQPLPSEGAIALNVKLQPILKLLDHSFGTQQKDAGTNNVDRAKAVLAFICGISPSTLQESHANREHEPFAKALCERCDTELRRAIPMLSAMEKISLLRSGYPVGSGKDSLAELCATSGRPKNGAGEAILLFSQSREKNDPYTPWSADLLRGATAALKNAHYGVTANYMKGLRRMFSPSSAWASQAHELFNETTVKLPISTLTDIYTRIRESKAFAVELKYAVLSTIIDSINRATKEFFRDDLVVLKDSGRLPLITKQDIEPLRIIVQRHAKASEIPRNEVEKFTATLKRWISDATPRAGNVAAQSHESGVTINRERGDVNSGAAAQLSDESAVPNVSQEVTGALLTLGNESLRDYIVDLLNRGLRDPSSELSEAFTRTLENLPLERLLGIRSVLESTQEIPESHLRAVEGRIQNEFRSTPGALDAVGLADLYTICVRMGARQSEIAQVLQALRTRLRLPPNETSATPSELSPAGLLVWRWMFSDLPPDGELLADMTRVHFNKMTGHLARRVSFNTPRGSALDATLRYGEELGLLESFKPDRALIDAPLAKLIIFTTLTRQHFGDKYGIVDTLVDSICSRLISGEVQSKDLFSQHWRPSTNARAIEELSREITKRLARSTTSTSFEDLARLVANIRFLERKGPSHFGGLYQYLRPLFVEQISRALPRQLQERDPQALRRSLKAIAATRHRSLELLDALSNECVTHIESFSPDEFAEIGSNFATLKSGTPTFWSTFASRVERDWHSFSDEMRIGAIISLVLRAPEKVPQSFDSYTMVARSGARSYEKVVQALIALGRYIPKAHDNAYRRLTTMQTPHELYQHEIDFMRELPALIGVPAKSIFSQVIVGGFETDFVVDFGHRRLIIELDGAAHFLTGPDGGMLQGRDEFQDIVFRRLGYEVIHVPFHSREQGHTKGGLEYPMLHSVAAILKREALDPETVPRAYLEPLKPNNGGPTGEPPSENTEPL
jgi:hypothetical protein